MSLKRAPGAWALNYAACVQCNQTDTKHMGKGLCRRCYFEKYNAENIKEIRRYKRKWHEANMPPEFQKLLREQLHYGGNREAALKRDGYKCVRCGKTQRLCVHHKDGKGRNMPVAEKNNSLENLQTLCLSCHLKIHRSELRAALKSKASEWWCYMRKLRACIDCGRSDRKHQSGGRCLACTTRYRKNQKN